MSFLIALTNLKIFARLTMTMTRMKMEVKMKLPTGNIIAGNLMRKSGIIDLYILVKWQTTFCLCYMALLCLIGSHLNLFSIAPYLVAWDSLILANLCGLLLFSPFWFSSICGWRGRQGRESLTTYWVGASWIDTPD